MSEPERRQVHVRRSPRIGVFLGLGAVAGALVAIIAGSAAPQDSATPREQAVGYLLLLLAPLGAILGGAIALVLDRIAERRVRVVEAERTGPARPAETPAETDAETDGTAEGEALAEADAHADAEETEPVRQTEPVRHPEPERTDRA